MKRCPLCDHTAKDHVASFDGSYVTLQCEQDYCNCDRFMRIDDMMEHPR